MKKVIFLVFSTLLLIGCSNEQVEESQANNTEENKVENNQEDIENSGESESFVLKPVNEFIEHYNNMASLTDELSPLNLEQPRDENGAQILLQEDTYGVLAIFDDADNVTTYSVGLTREDSYSDLEGSGLYATMHVAEALDLDFKKIADEFEVALNEDEHTYIDGSHMVIFENHERSGKSGLGMMVRFMNLTLED